MKVLMVLESDFPPDIRVEKEALSLMKDGHEVTIAGITLRKEFASETVYKGIRIFKKRISTFTHKSSVAALRFPFYFRFWKRYLDGLMRRFEFDIVHIHDLPLAKVGSWLKHRYNCKLIVDLHENYPALVEISPYSKTCLGRLLISIKQWRAYERRMLHSADAVVTVIDEMAERIVKLGIEPDKISIVPNMPDLEDLTPLNNNPDTDYITLFYSGGISYHRGLQIVIVGLSKLIGVHKNVRLWIVGKGAYLKNIENLVEQLDLQENVIFWGWKPFEDMVELLCKSDVALIPHLRSEQSDHSSPNKLYEYMYYGKAVMSSDCRSVVRILNETKAGITYISDDPDSFVSRFELLKEGKDRDEFGENGIKAIKSNLNWRTSSEVLCALYKTLL